MLRKRAAIMLLLVLLAPVPMGRVSAHTYIVNSLDDPGDGTCDLTECTLREAINAAQFDCWDEVDLIKFDVSLSGGTIRLKSQLPDLKCPMVIDGDVDGDGSADITISGDSDGDGDADVARAFNIYAWDGASDPDIEVRNIRFEKFSSEAIGAHPSGHLLLLNVHISDSGYGINAWPTGRLTLEGSTVTGCSNYGLYLVPQGGRIEVLSSEVWGSGGGGPDQGGVGIIKNWDGTVILEDVKVHGNRGHGVNVYQSSPSTSSVIIRGSKIRGNSLQGVSLNGEGTALTGVLIRENDIHGNGHQGILVFGRAEGVWIDRNDVHENGYEGIKVDASGGDATVNIIQNRIFRNGDVGIKLVGNVHHSLIRGNVIGVYSGSPAPNGDGTGPKGDGGILLQDGPTRNIIEGNEVAYNHYQNVALSGWGTEGNIIRGNWIHCDPDLPKPLCYVGVIVSGGASRNLIGGSPSEPNIVAGHRYEGIVILGLSDQNEVSHNRVGAFDSSGGYTGNRADGNGAGIAVISEARPSVNFPFPVYATDPTYYHRGPKSTSVHDNSILGNRGDGVIMIWAVDFDVHGNDVSYNSGNGIYWIGSTGRAWSNTIENNDLNGVRIEPFWGYSEPGHQPLSPSTPDDDVISRPTDAGGYGLYLNTIRYNGQYGVHIVDNPWVRLDYLTNPSRANNQISGNSLGNARKVWFGYVKVEDPHGDPVLGRTVEILRDDGDSSADYVSSTHDSEGRYGPPGFSYDDVTTWFQIVEEEISGSVYRNYNVHTFRIPGSLPLIEFYSWDGRYPYPSGESGGALESPSGSGAHRYQFARVTYREAERSPYAGSVVINEILYRQRTCAQNNESIELYFNDEVDISGWKITDGSEGLLCSGHFEFTFPSGSRYGRGSYVIVWIGSSGDAPWADGQYWVGCGCVLNDNGDDIWLLDADGRVVDYVAYGSDNGIRDAPPPGMWDGNNAPAGAERMQSISLTPNGKVSDSGLDWELTTSGSVVGPVTVDTDGFSWTYYGTRYYAKDSLGRNNNHLIDLMVKEASSPSYVYDDIYEFPYLTQVVSSTTGLGEPVSFDIRLEYEKRGEEPLSSDEKVRLSASHSCPGWSIEFYDGATPITLPADFTLTPGSPLKDLRMVVIPGMGSCGVTLTLSYHDDSEGYDFPYDQVLISMRTPPAAGQAAAPPSCLVRAYLHARDADGPPLRPGDALNYTLEVESWCPGRVSVRAEIALPEQLRLDEASLRTRVGSSRYERELRMVIWAGEIDRGRFNVTSFNATVARADLGGEVTVQANLSCEGGLCSALRYSDDPITPHVDGDPTVRLVNSTVLWVRPGEILNIPVNLRGSFEVRRSCEWRILSPEGTELGDLWISRGSGELKVMVPEEANYGEDCLISLIPRSRDPLLSSLGILNFTALLRVSPILNVTVRLDAVPREADVGGPIHLILTASNDGNVPLTARILLPLEGLRFRYVLHGAGRVESNGALVWWVDLPPRSSRSLRFVATALREGSIWLQGNLTYWFEGVAGSSLTDDPSTPQRQDPTGISIRQRRGAGELMTGAPGGGSAKESPQSTSSGGSVPLSEASKSQEGSEGAQGNEGQVSQRTEAEGSVELRQEGSLGWLISGWIAAAAAILAASLMLLFAVRRRG